ncbi:hypothetical protein Raf01_71970 [Rugosimonospora africana]|uniref:Uncharacterized protein n=1 Tax=Rugosimonospora africana TaxID=556532 RepID=A0A8J3R0B7_9ACTN|nr:hypothetical protein Raf01_71970 [Rugosimonospora africana]
MRGLGLEVFVKAKIEGVLDPEVDEYAGTGEHEQHRRGEPGHEAYPQRHPAQGANDPAVPRRTGRAVVAAGA